MSPREWEGAELGGVPGAEVCPGAEVWVWGSGGGEEGGAM